jgi:hypothetical protein
MVSTYRDRADMQRIAEYIRIDCLEKVNQKKKYSNLLTLLRYNQNWIDNFLV